MSTQVATRNRFPELTQAIIDKTAERVRAGADILDTLQQFGVSERSAYRWLQRGKGEHPELPAVPPYTTLADAVAQAEAERVTAAEVSIAADEDWRARARWLATKRERWREKPLFASSESPATALLEGFAAAMKLAADAREKKEDARDDGLVIEQAPRLVEGVAADEGDERG